MASKETKDRFEKLCIACDAVEKAGGKPADIRIPLRELFIFDLQRFFMYLSASDGKVLPEEAEYMNGLFGADHSVNEYVKRIDDSRIYSVDFENDLPFSLKIAALAEQRFGGLTDEDGNELSGLSTQIFELYREAGIEFLGCDKDVNERESNDLGMYLARKRMQLQQLLGGDDE